MGIIMSTHDKAIYDQMDVVLHLKDGTLHANTAHSHFKKEMFLEHSL